MFPDFMRPAIILTMAFLSVLQLHSQELFVFSEPASNMPAHSMSAKIGARYAVPGHGRAAFQRYTPELMFGLSKNWMIHATGFLSDFYSSGVRPEGGRLYGKYRFLSVDQVHRHFRMAAFAEAALSRNVFTYHDFNLSGDNSGFDGGLIATQLLSRLAISGTVSYLNVYPKQSRVTQKSGRLDAVNYSAAAGFLVLPKVYRSFDQTNLNIYFEMNGMQDLKDGGSMIELAPALQVIIKSNFKINAGYKFQVAGDMYRIAERSWVLGFERTFLGVLKR